MIEIILNNLGDALIVGGVIVMLAVLFFVYAEGGDI